MARRVRSNVPKQLERDKLADMVLRTFGAYRWTQDSPIVPDVWIKYIQKEWADAYARIVLERAADEGEEPDLPRVDLLITPWTGSTPGKIARRIRSTLEGREADIAPSSTRVAAELTFSEMFAAVLPLTGWWQSWLKKLGPDNLVYIPNAWQRDATDLTVRAPMRFDWLRMEVLAGYIALIRFAKTGTQLLQISRLCEHLGAPPQRLPGERALPREAEDQPQRDQADNPTNRDMRLDPKDGVALIEAFGRLLANPPVTERKVPDAEADRVTMVTPDPLNERIWMVNLNRQASTTMFDSRKTVKADAAQRVFDTGGRGVTVAVVDVGIDATHPGFFDRHHDQVIEALQKAKSAVEGEDIDELTVFGPADLPWSSRVRATYDFTLLRDLMSRTANRTLKPNEIAASRTTLSPQDVETALDHLAVRAASGRGMDWALVEPLIRIPHNDHYAERPLSIDHGTHVAGIIAADLPSPPEYDKSLKGICPEVWLYDMRVFDDKGESSEYAILAAIEFVGWLNRNRNEPVIHAVNLSLALAHDVDSFACGRTPICDACNQLVGSGTVVVAAAGNTGFESLQKQSLGTGFRTVSITDPGNADEVITVGSTHRRDPHAYGVSYFSSRGPTADGRRKPDLLAPGEKINSTVFDGLIKPLDGTSMAAPHVTGAAALLMARYPELIGQPRKIKQVLMESATDLGREQSFQGAGLLDILRALQSI